MVVFTSGRNEKDKLELTNKQMEYICKMLINQCFDYDTEETKNIIHEYEQGYSANLPAFCRYKSMFTADLYNEYIKPYCKHEEESKAIFDFIFYHSTENNIEISKHTLLLISNKLMRYIQTDFVDKEETSAMALIHFIEISLYKDENAEFKYYIS